MINVVLLLVVLVAICVSLSVWRSSDALDAVAVYCAARACALRHYRITLRRSMEAEANFRRNIASDIKKQEAALDAAK